MAPRERLCPSHPVLAWHARPQWPGAAEHPLHPQLGLAGGLGCWEHPACAGGRQPFFCWPGPPAPGQLCGLARVPTGCPQPASAHAPWEQGRKAEQRLSPRCLPPSQTPTGFMWAAGAALRPRLAPCLAELRSCSRCLGLSGLPAAPLPTLGYSSWGKSARVLLQPCPGR